MHNAIWYNAYLHNPDKPEPKMTGLLPCKPRLSGRARHERAGGRQAETSIQHLIHNRSTRCYPYFLVIIQVVAFFSERYWRSPLVFSMIWQWGRPQPPKPSAGGMRRGQECPRCQIIGKTRDADINVKRIRPPPEYVHFLPQKAQK